MALTKCLECGQEISTEAKACPHCGKPLITEHSKNRKETIKALIGFIILIIIFLSWYLYSNGISKKIKFNPFNEPQVRKESKRNTIEIQEVNNLGYSFYLAQIDNPNNNNLTDDFKNQVTKIISDAHFPKLLLINLPIVVLNNLALTNETYVQVHGNNYKIPELGANFLSEGGLYAKYSNDVAMIIINKSIIEKGQLRDALTHELGHAIGGKLTEEQWKKFYELRHIPTGTERMGSNWNLSPNEDFAEVYKNTYTGLDVRTFYGDLVPTLGFEMTCQLKANIPKESSTEKFHKLEDYTNILNQSAAIDSLSSCRRDVLLNREKYQSDWQYGVPYKSSVNQSTKDFVTNLVNKYN